MKKTTLLVSFGVMVLLYLIGYFAKIDLLTFKMSLSETNISFVPIVVGLLIALTSDRVKKRSNEKQVNTIK